MNRLAAVFALELRTLLRRPMLWTLALVLVLMSWGMSTGSVMLGTGSAMVGGRKAWITSEFSAAFILAVLAASMYSFFVSIASGLAVGRDDELKVGELLHSTRLKPGEYVWGKALAQIGAFALVLALHLAFIVLFNHLLPNPQAAEIRGPFAIWNYLRPALVFSLPTIVFFAGVAFWIGERWRRPVLAFLLPIGCMLVSFSLLWNWSPGWLDPAWNRLLMLLDPSGFRWLSETWLKLDRGADFYNTARIGLDATLAANRLLFLSLGVAGVAFAHRHLARTLRRSGRVRSSKRRWLRRWRRRPTVAPTVPPVGPMRQSVPGFVVRAGRFAAAELGALARDPGLYLFAFFILLQTMGTTMLDVGPFDAPVLVTPGLAATGSFNTLSLLVCLLMMFFLVESLERERSTGMAPLVYSAPGGTTAYLVGKVAGNSLAAVSVLVAVFVAGAVVILGQGQVALSATPYLIVWGLLLLPTFLVWSSFLCAVQALAGNRYLTYGVALSVIALTLYRQFTDRMNWVGNWLMWDTVRWSDVSVLELDRRAIVLNRLFVLALAGLFLAIAVRAFRRRRPDATRLAGRLRPRPLVGALIRLAPAAVAPLALGGVLWFGVLHGSGGEAAERDHKNYWKQNLATWRDAPQPSLAALEADVRLEPASSELSSRGSFELVNHHDEPLERFALTGGRQWREPGWTLDGEPYQPEDRSGLYVFTPAQPLAPGGRLEVGFSFSGSYPGGMSKNGGGDSEFVLPGGVVLTGFSASFLPLVGYREEVGVDDDNRHDPPEPDPRLYREVVPPLLGNQQPFTSRVRIDVPEEYEAHSVGVRESESVAGGRRVSVWVSDRPVRLVNIVAGRWQVRRGEGTAVYYFAEHPHNVDEIARTLEAARRHYSEWFQPYPWRELRLSEFPALAAYGQGFPTNITFSEGIGFLTREDPKTNLVMMVTAHEAAHQWWGNLLTPGDGPGGNILSEGMAHFATAMLIERLGGERRRMEFAKRTEERYGDRRRRDAERPLVATDGTQPGDRTVMYDKGMWVFWMLMREIGREPMLAGLREFMARFQNGPDYPLLEDLVETLRPHAPDPERYDRFTRQWFFEVSVPELRLHEARRRADGDGWLAEARLENHGSGAVEVELAAAAGERWDGDRPAAGYREARTRVRLGAGESVPISIAAPFAPDRLVVDPDVQLLQLRRNAALAELG